jgi:hypothetical protein
MEQLFGLGVANIFGSAFSAYPSTGIKLMKISLCPDIKDYCAHVVPPP